MTSRLLWEEYYSKHPDGYKLSQFRHYLAIYRKKKSISMPIEHLAGDKVFIDYAGAHLYLTDPETEEITPVEVLSRGWSL